MPGGRKAKEWKDFVPFAHVLRKLLPPTHLLRAFVVTARCGSVAQAAAELHLTAGAVSKQVIELEHWLRTALFERVKKRLVLSPTGARYLGRIQPLLDEIEAATLDLFAGGGAPSTVTLSTLPTFGAKWLFPRLPAFQRRHPEIELRFVPYQQGYDFANPALDCAIRYGAGHWPGADADYLIGRDAVVIAPPACPGQVELREPADVCRFTLLHHVSDAQAWSQWCEAHQVRGVNPLAGPRLEIVSTLVSAVRGGMGIALLPRCLVEDDIAAGVVNAPLRQRYVASRGYYGCYPQGKAALPAVSRFRQWLRESVPAGTL